jgi:hypothetical protein
MVLSTEDAHELIDQTANRLVAQSKALLASLPGNPDAERKPATALQATVAWDLVDITNAIMRDGTIHVVQDDLQLLYECSLELCARDVVYGDTLEEVLLHTSGVLRGMRARATGVVALVTAAEDNQRLSTDEAVSRRIRSYGETVFGNLA